MRILYVEFSNFASYGSDMHRVEFDRNNPGLFLVTGQNGHGKSTIAEVIKFGLYGKIPDKKLKDMANRINGGGLTRICFETAKGQNVLVERTLDPSSIKLTVDGEAYKKANKKGPQEYLMDELLEIPFHVFVNSILISCEDFKSFLTMSPSDKRAIIDKIFGFAIINSMRVHLKNEIKAVVEELTRIDAGMAALNRSIASSTAELDSLSAQILKDDQAKVEEATQKLTQYKELLNVHAGRVKEFGQIEIAHRVQKQKASDALSELRSQERQILSKLKLYDNHQCPQCGSDLHTNTHQEIADGLKTELGRSKGEIIAADLVIAEMNQKESEIISKRNEISEKGYKINKAIADLEFIVRNSKKVSDKREIESIKQIMRKMDDDLREHLDRKAAGDSDVTWKRILDEALGDSGIKQLAIKSIIPGFNSEISKMMFEMHLDFTMEFDENFDAKITQLGQEVPISSLSRGEKSKMNFVILFAILRLMKMRFPGINILFLDEIFGPLDMDGVHSILQILSNNVRQIGLNTFVINQHPIPTDVFDYHVDVIKGRDKFSSFTIDAL